MPVNGLEEFIVKNLLHTSKIDPDLTNCGLGIDASHYLRQLYLRDSIKSSLSPALGGIPLALKAEVEKDLAMFAKHATRVQFCFDGLDLYQFNLREDKSMKPDVFMGKRRAAWDAWARLAEKGRYADAKGRDELAKQVRDAFDNATELTPAVDRYLMEILVEHDIDFIVAPVSAKAQLTYFVNHPTLNFIDCIYSDADILLYEIDRVILGIDFDAGNFTWTFKEDIRDYKQGTFNAASFHEAFMDACLLAGGVYDCPILPSIAGSFASMGAVFIFERAFDVLRTYGHGIIVIRELSSDHPEYVERFARTKGILTYMPIIKDDGTVETLSKKNVPNNIAMLITPRLANEIYFYISRRLVGTNMYDLLISDHLKVHAPLDGGESQEYKKLLNDMIPLRTTCLSLLAGHSNRFLHHKHLTVTYWYQPDVQVDLPVYHIFKQDEAPYGRTKTWNVPIKTINLISKTSDIRGYVLALRNPDNAKRTIVARNDEHLLHSLEEIYANVWWKTLQLRNFVKDDHTLTPWGIGLAEGLEKLAVHKDLYEALYLGLELFRLKVLHHEDFSVKYSGAAMHGSDNDKKHIRYICRLACATSLKNTPNRWDGPVSKAYLAFNSMVMEFSRNMRNLVEMVVLAMSIQGDVTRIGREVFEWTQLGMMLPFGKELNTTLAIVTRCKLEETMCRKRKEGISVEKELALVEVDSVQSLVPDVTAEIGRVYALWDAFVLAVKRADAAGATFADNSKLREELVKIEETNSWLAELRD